MISYCYICATIFNQLKAFLALLGLIKSKTLVFIADKLLTTNFGFDRQVPIGSKLQMFTTKKNHPKVVNLVSIIYRHEILKDCGLYTHTSRLRKLATKNCKTWFTSYTTKLKKNFFVIILMPFTNEGVEPPCQTKLTIGHLYKLLFQRALSLRRNFFSLTFAILGAQAPKMAKHCFYFWANCPPLVPFRAPFTAFRLLQIHLSCVSHLSWAKLLSASCCKSGSSAQSWF